MFGIFVKLFGISSNCTHPVSYYRLTVLFVFVQHNFPSLSFTLSSDIPPLPLSLSLHTAAERTLLWLNAMRVAPHVVVQWLLAEPLFTGPAA